MTLFFGQLGSALLMPACVVWRNVHADLSFFPLLEFFLKFRPFLFVQQLAFQCLCTTQLPEQGSWSGLNIGTIVQNQWIQVNNIYISQIHCR